MSPPDANLPNQAPPATLQQLREALAFITDQYDRAAEGVGDVFTWLWEAIQGDFNVERSTGQIVFDSAISMIPVVDQICDVRDIIANCKHIKEDSSDTWAWVALGLTLIGLFPTLGSLIKGVLKIFFLFVRRSGGRAVAQAVEEAMTWVVTFLRRQDVQRYWRHLRIDHIFDELANLARQVRNQINLRRLLQAFDRGIALIRNLVNKVERVPVVGRRARQTLDLVLDVRRMADNGLRRALRPLQDAMDTIIRRLELEDMLHRAAIVNAHNIHFRGALPADRAVTLMRNAEPPPRWLKQGEPTYPGLNPERLRTRVARMKASGYPDLTDAEIESFHRMKADTIDGPARLYRVVSPGNMASGADWVTEETFLALQRAANPKDAWRSGLAVWPHWNTDGQFVVYEIKAGEQLKVWRGPAASQIEDALPGHYLEGGMEQIKFHPTRPDGAATPLPELADAVGYYRRGADGRMTRANLTYDNYRALPPEQKAQYEFFREDIRHPAITGPFETHWGYTDFDAQMIDAKLGLPALPGQITKTTD